MSCRRLLRRRKILCVQFNFQSSSVNSKHRRNIRFPSLFPSFPLSFFLFLSLFLTLSISLSLPTKKIKFNTIGKTKHYHKRNYMYSTSTVPDQPFVVVCTVSSSFAYSMRMCRFFDKFEFIKQILIFFGF